MTIGSTLNKAMIATLGLLLLVSLNSCSQTLLSKQRPELSRVPSEVIYDVELKDKSIWYTVKSNGCTAVSKFRVEVEIIEDTSFVTLIRLVPDNCKARSRMMVIDMNLDERYLKSSKIVFKNPFAKKFVNQFKQRKITKRQQIDDSNT